MTLHDLEAGVKGQTWHLQKICRTQPMIREILGLFDMAPFDMKDVIWKPICLQNKVKITLRQAFFPNYILCKSDTASCNIKMQLQ